ncbi:LOW QUALITY PROTEIN: hypothetical protein YC2023_035593 [Brassica napus]
MLEKSEGGFVDDVYKKYIQSKLETNETVVNEGSDGGGKREAGEKGSGGADLKNAAVTEARKGYNRYILFQSFWGRKRQIVTRFHGSSKEMLVESSSAIVEIWVMDLLHQHRPTLCTTDLRNTQRSATNRFSLRRRELRRFNITHLLLHLHVSLWSDLILNCFIRYVADARFLYGLAGLGIKVTLKPEHRITPPPPLLPRVGDITRSSFQFDFCLERKVLAEAEKDNLLPHLLKLYHIINEVGFPIQGVDPVVMKYAGLSREVVNIAVANYGDNPTKLHLSYFHLSHSIHRSTVVFWRYTLSSVSRVCKWVHGVKGNGGGFPTNAVADALFMFENDTEKALSHLLPWFFLNLDVIIFWGTKLCQ